MTSMLNRNCWLLSKVYTTFNLKHALVREMNEIKKKLLKENQNKWKIERKEDFLSIDILKPKSLSSIYRKTF